MNFNIQYEIRNNPNYFKYIRENSNWYKNLNRDPNNFKIFKEEVKENYHLRNIDKITKAMDTFELIQNVVMNMK